MRKDIKEIECVATALVAMVVSVVLCEKTRVVSFENLNLPWAAFFIENAALHL
jgi:hypothetical protein